MSKRTQLLNIVELGVARSQWDHVMTQDAIVALSQEFARRRLQDATSPRVNFNSDPLEPLPPAIQSLTDNSTGVAASPIEYVAIPRTERGVVDGTTAYPTKATFDDMLSEVNNAHLELADMVNQMISAIMGFDGSSPISMTNYGGEAADGEIAAISAPSKATSGCVDAASALLEIEKIRGWQSMLISGINYVRFAVGMQVHPDPINGLFNRTVDGWDADSVNYSSTDSAATTGQFTLDDTSLSETMTAVRNNIATMSSSLNSLMGSLGFGLYVVATSNPRSRTVTGLRPDESGGGLG